MARTQDPHSATSQFFINHKDNDFLDHSGKTARGWGYTVFGKVTEGMQVVDKIAASPTRDEGGAFQNMPSPPVIIQSIQRID
jgi:peptidyl-prolyl cis-trans isomerase B (cyclophilin B)